ncbi:FecR family protein [Sphingomonas sp. UNC305MFCol5.2]|uniref:FecR family protein n=1 Tax=Sphingomonas sp. UNC305MFCol5.2 TaxID=1449076 RepID=UPI000691DCE1|nr:FecR domain-containing protein [Sphingomonas sp. UNC305MFCol5.2]
MASESDEAVREAAAEWFARMRAPDAGRDRRAFEAWLAEDSRHRRMYERMRVTWAQSRLVTHTPVGQAWEGLPPRARSRSIPWGYAIAASIAALLVVVLLLAHRAPTGGPGSPGQEIASQIGIRHVRLADGTRVTLDAGTRLAVRFVAGERRLILRAGRARFEVARDTARPFIVAAGNREVVATGTTFDVCLVAGRIEVALLSGSVDVRGAGARFPSPVLARLAPGQSLALDPGASRVAPRPSTPDDLGWVWGMFDFDGVPLREVIATANRYSTRHIALADPTLGELKVTGGFKVGDPAALAAALAAAFGLQVQESADGELVLRRLRPASAQK